MNSIFECDSNTEFLCMCNKFKNKNTCDNDIAVGIVTFIMIKVCDEETVVGIVTSTSNNKVSDLFIMLYIYKIILINIISGGVLFHTVDNQHN